MSRTQPPLKKTKRTNGPKSRNTPCRNVFVPEGWRMACMRAIKRSSVNSILLVLFFLVARHRCHKKVRTDQERIKRNLVHIPALRGATTRSPRWASTTMTYLMWGAARPPCHYRWPLGSPGLPREPTGAEKQTTPTPYILPFFENKNNQYDGSPPHGAVDWEVPLSTILWVNSVLFIRICISLSIYK